MAKRRDRGSFTQGKMHYGGPVAPEEAAGYIKEKYHWSDDVAHATKWANMRPICPYGCGEEGTLLEVIVQAGKALGIYTHSQSRKPFTAELQMAPKPTSHKVVIGPNGEPTIVEGVS